MAALSIVMLEYLSLAPFRRALIALAATGLAFPALGAYILALELVPARFAVMHAALLGAALGLLAGLPPLVPALAAALIAGAGIAKLSERSVVSAGGPLGLVMASCLALALIIFHKVDVNAVEAFSLFWGSALALSAAELAVAVAGSLIVVLVSLIFLREIRSVLYDRALASAQGVPARAVYYALVMLVCFGIGVSMKVTGALMIDAVTILPALAARSLRQGYRATLVWGSVFGLAINFGGFALAIALDLPSSPAIIVVGTIVVLITGWVERSRQRLVVF